VTAVGSSVSVTEAWPRQAEETLILTEELHRPARVATAPLYTLHHPMRRASASPARALLRIAALMKPAAESLLAPYGPRFGPCSHRFYGFDGTVDGPIDDGFRLLDA